MAVEFAIIKVRSSRIDQLVSEKTRCTGAKKVTSNLDEYLSACQLGITITALGLGWLGNQPLNIYSSRCFKIKILTCNFQYSFIYYCLCSNYIFTCCHWGTCSKDICYTKAEQVSLLLSKPLIYFYRVMYPFIWALNGSARVVTGLLGLHPASEHEVAHSEEELRLILSESYESGEINQREFKYVNNIFEFDNRVAKEIMVPRTEVVGLYEDEPFETHIKVIAQEKYTRYPVFGEDKDEIIGMVNVKDLFIRYMDGNRDEECSIMPYTRPVIEVLENIPIHDLLLQMQRKHIPLAVLYDEYGGTAGIVTLEDILEEIVGEIRDEYDEDENPPIEHISEGYKIVEGKVLISEVNDLLGIHLIADDVDTIGGWIMVQNKSLLKEILLRNTVLF